MKKSKDLFERLLRISNNFDFHFDPDEDGSLIEEED